MPILTSLLHSMFGSILLSFIFTHIVKVFAHCIYMHCVYYILQYILVDGASDYNFGGSLENFMLDAPKRSIEQN